MSYKVIKGNNFENFPKLWQHWAGDPLQGVFEIYERYRYWLFHNMTGQKT